jgi:beta-galactosidase/beta-glucuronidase
MGFLNRQHNKLMMSRFSLLLAFICISFYCGAQWKMVEGRIATEWSDRINPESPLPDYPRPQMVRENWKSLNGLWDYQIKPRSDKNVFAPAGKILVPFPVESALSGVGKVVGTENNLWYKNSFSVPSSFKGKNVLLHFGAVDWECEVYVNGKSVGVHRGGYDPFSFDITSILRSGQQEIVVRVYDPSDDGPQPRGKQVKKPNSIWYTPVTGIWQTVWIEAVPKTYISSTRQTPDLDRKSVSIAVRSASLQPGDKFRYVIKSQGVVTATQESVEDSVYLNLTDPVVWSPENPHLYDLEVSIIRKGKVVDRVSTYFAMRKISMAPDKNGIQRMLLNNQFVFQYGPLDQGWWPDGLYTAPNDEALKFDIQKTKDLGFNMIRKHVKVEPARWYYHCDKLGMLVWQDMPSGDMGNRWDSRPGIVGLATSRERTAESEAIYRTEWKAIMNANYNFPSIVVWVPFNEAWGQFKTREIVEWTQRLDPSRLVNEASGGNFEYSGHILDLHNYPDPCMPSPVLFGEKQILVLGEYGGLGLPVENHTWQGKDNWGYQSFKSKEELVKKYESFIDRFPELIRTGLSAAIYTQTTDVEIEVNGLMTYDRKIVKMPEARLKEIHQKLYDQSLVDLK